MDGAGEGSSVRCRSCGGPMIRVDATSGLAACDYCGAIQMFRPADALRPPAPKSERITLEQTAEGTRIRYRWISGARVFLAIFGVLLVPPLLILAAAVATRSVAAAAAVIPLAMAVFIVVAFVQLFQRTFFQVHGGQVCVWESPALLSRERCFKAAEIAQLFCTLEAHVGGRQGYEYGMYGLSVALKDGRSVKLMGRFPEATDALFIEEAVEKALGPTDRPVPGELPR